MEKEKFESEFPTHLVWKAFNSWTSRREEMKSQKWKGKCEIEAPKATEKFSYSFFSFFHPTFHHQKNIFTRESSFQRIKMISKMLEGRKKTLASLRGGWERGWGGWASWVGKGRWGGNQKTFSAFTRLNSLNVYSMPYFYILLGWVSEMLRIWISRCWIQSEILPNVRSFRLQLIPWRRENKWEEKVGWNFHTETIGVGKSETFFMRFPHPLGIEISN